MQDARPITPYHLSGSGNFGAKSYCYLQIATLPLISNAKPGVTPYLVETEHLTTIP